MDLALVNLLQKLRCRLFRAKNAVSTWLSSSPLRVLLLLALVQGLIYTFLIPPWWHYDEPGHFEFAWQIVHFDHWPKNEFDEQMRRELARSLMHYQYYKIRNYTPNFDSDEPVFIGIAPQYTDYPLYYLVASLPLRFLGKADFALQNRAVRLVSLAMFLITIWAAWKALGELLSAGHPIQWMTTLFMVFLPGFVDTMTAINDDVGAVLAFSLFIWAVLRLTKRGFSWKRFLILGVTLLLCYFTKKTAWLAFVAVPFAILLAIFRERKRWLAWGAWAATLAVLVVLTLRWGDARFWYRVDFQDDSTRLRRLDAPLGEYVFHLHYREGQAPWIGQFMGRKQMRPLRRQSVTLGAWMWTDRPVTIHFPILRMAIYKGEVAYSPSKTITLTATPTFYALTFEVPSEAEYGWLELPPISGKEEVHVYYDGLVLVEGVRTGTPHFNDLSAQSGVWDGQPFQNRLRGASAESAQLYFNPLLLRVLKRWGGVYADPNIFLASLQDWSARGDYYRAAGSTLFRTFWAYLAANKLKILGGAYSYEIAQWYTYSGIVGAIVLLWRKRRVVQWAELTVLALVMIGVWGLAIARGGVELLIHYPVVPWARYAFPAIIPTALLLCAGWWEVMRWLRRLFNLSPKQLTLFFICAMLTWNFFALLSVAKYFYWDKYPELEYALLLLLVTILTHFTLSGRAGLLNVFVKDTQIDRE